MISLTVIKPTEPIIVTANDNHDITNHVLLSQSESSIRKLRIEDKSVALQHEKAQWHEVQDVVILLKIIAKSDQPWQNKDLAAELFISYCSRRKVAANTRNMTKTNSLKNLSLH